MIRALFFDLDGTLLTDDKKMLPSTYDALTLCKKKGIRIFLATGRSARLDKMLGWTEQELSLFDGGIYCNGASLILGDKTKNLFIDPDAVRNCISQVARYEDVHMSLHMENNIHAFNHTLPEKDYGPWGITKNEIVEITEECICSAVKILIYYDYLVDNDIKTLPPTLYHELSAYCKGKATIYLTDQGRTIQLAPLGASKYRSVEKFRTALGLDKDEIAVFGDDLNDVEMLQNYRYSVAMGNAAEEVKLVAAYTTMDSNNHGIYSALNDLLKII